MNFIRSNDQIINVLKESQNALDEIKSTQPLGGASFVNYTTRSDDNFDFSYSQTGYYKSIRVTFTHSIPESWHINELNVFGRVNNPNVMANPIAANNTDYEIRITPERPYRGKQTWIVETVQYQGGTNDFYLKFYVKGTTGGTITAQTL